MFPTRHAPYLPAQSRVRPASLPAPRPRAAALPQSGSAGSAPTDFDHHVVLVPTRYPTYLPDGLPAAAATGPAFGVLPTEEGGTVMWAVR
jgi:hypothetical protein